MLHLQHFINSFFLFLNIAGAIMITALNVEDICILEVFQNNNLVSRIDTADIHGKANGNTRAS